MGSVQFSPIIEMMREKLHVSFISSLGGLIRQTVCSKFTLMALNDLQEVLVKPNYTMSITLLRAQFTLPDQRNALYTEHSWINC